MAFKIFKIERKNDNWIVASLVDATGEIQENVSINKISKKGDIFPGFDELAKDQKVEGRLWKSDSDKLYLFAPKGGAKAAYRASERADIAYDKKADEEYPISEKLETILNKQVAHQIKLEQILELLQPKKKVTEYPNDFNEPAF